MYKLLFCYSGESELKSKRKLSEKAVAIIEKYILKLIIVQISQTQIRLLIKS